MIAQYALARAKPRPHRRLLPRIDEMAEVLRKAAADNPDLRAEHPALFGSKQASS